MFEYFPENYTWSHGVMLAVSMGGAISEIDEACRSLREASKEMTFMPSRHGMRVGRSWPNVWKFLHVAMRRRGSI
jgi:hypothetical protein